MPTQPLTRRGASEQRAAPRERRGTPVTRRSRFGGTDGNEVLTTATAALLVALLLAEGVTILQMDGLLRVHMFIGMVLIPPVALKLGTTGYRFARYYTGNRAYREKGPPVIWLRMLAPVLVLMTIGVLATGVWLMALGHKSDTVLLLHKATFIIWGAAFGIHFLAYIPRVLRSLRDDWRGSRRQAVPGSSMRAMLVAASLGGGVALALAVLGTIGAWHGHHGG